MGSECTILVLDDVSSVRKSVISTIRGELDKVTVLESSEVSQALKMLKETPKVDYILSDIDLKSGRGLEFLSEARKLPSTQQASMVIMSAKRDQDSLLSAAAAGVSDFIAKPFNPNILLAKLRKLIAQRRASERVSLLEIYSAQVSFADADYQARLIDLSLSGCLMRSERFTHGGGYIYDKAMITIEYENTGPIPVEAEIVRLEHDVESSNQSTVLVAFQFCGGDKDSMRKLSEFIANAKKAKVN